MIDDYGQDPTLLYAKLSPVRLRRFRGLIPPARAPVDVIDVRMGPLLVHTNYEIDLSAENIAEFKSAIGGFMESARKVKATSNGRRAGSTGSGGAQHSREQTRAVREWARQHGHHISERGRIPASIQQAFDQAHAAV